MRFAARLLGPLLICFLSTPAAAKTPLKVCRATCTTQVAGACADLRKGKLKRCRARLWKQCRKGTLSCAQTTTTITGTTIPLCLSPFTVSPDYLATADAGIVVIDLNHDDKNDVIAVGNGSPSVTVRLGDGTGVLGDHHEYAVGGDPRALAVADLNGDGDLDVAVSNFMTDPPQPGPAKVANVDVLLGDGHGAFDAPAPYFVGTSDFHDVAAGNLNADDKPDLVVATRESAVVLLNDGDGTYAGKVDYPTGASLGRALVLADLNGDHKLDIAMASHSPSQVSVFLGVGDGTFGDPIAYETGRVPYGIVAADFNHDGKIDLATANNNHFNVSILLGKGDGSFPTHVEYDVGGLPQAIATADFNTDGNPDLAVSGATGGFVSLLGNADGTFRAAVQTFVGASIALAAGRLNADAKPDVAVGVPSKLRVLLNVCP